MVEGVRILKVYTSITLLMT